MRPRPFMLGAKKTSSARSLAPLSKLRPAPPGSQLAGRPAGGSGFRCLYLFCQHILACVDKKDAQQKRCTFVRRFFVLRKKASEMGGKSSKVENPVPFFKFTFWEMYRGLLKNKSVSNSPALPQKAPYGLPLPVLTRPRLYGQHKKEPW